MGNDNSKDCEFDRDNWRLIEKNPSHVLWRNRRNESLQIEEYNVYSKDEDDFRVQQEIFRFRHRHQLLISAYYFE